MATSLFDLTGKVALVTGAAQGMGRAMAIALAEAGADLLIVDRNEAGVRNTAAQIALLGGRVDVAVRDVSEPGEVRAIYAQLDNVFGRIDFAGNVAGESIMAPPEEIALEDVEQVWRNLVFGRFCSCQEAGRRMLKAGRGGSIVNIGSLASVTALGRGHVAYSMAMGAVAQMTRELSTEWAGHAIRVNAILPAQVLNPGLEQRIAANPALRTQFLSGIPAGRFGKPDDIQGLAVLLASDASSWITGALIPMDGGNLAMNGGGSVRHRKTAEEKAAQ
ncbi:MAG: SDR family oxidoreductase [Acidobacteria bacterium]|nr:SDR family oxidoreductase [Acidobacteriota bacterium]